MKNDMKELVGKLIEFLPVVGEKEGYARSGMRARIVSVRREYHDEPLEDQMLVITFDYSEFDGYNRNFESSNYYDDVGIACLTARQAGMYEENEDLYFGVPELYQLLDKEFKLLDERAITLIAQFRESGADNYVNWLESQISI